MDVFAIATSGMQAAVARLDVSASNIVNSPLESAMSADGGHTAPITAAAPYVPQQVVQFPLADGGVGVQTQAQSGDDLGLDLVTQMMALEQFKANASVFQTGEDAMKSLLSLKA